MTLLDGVKEEMESFKHNYMTPMDDPTLDEMAALINTQIICKDHVNALQDIINCHSQPLTPEQVVEWMASPGNEVDYDYDTALDMQEHTLFIGGREDACIMFRAFADTATFWVNLSGNRELEIPLSRFRNLDELKSFVRILTGEEV